VQRKILLLRLGHASSVWWCPSAAACSRLGDDFTVETVLAVQFVAMTGLAQIV